MTSMFEPSDIRLEKFAATWLARPFTDTVATWLLAAAVDASLGATSNSASA